MIRNYYKVIQIINHLDRPLFSAQFTRLLAYYHRAYIESLLSNTTKNYNYFPAIFFFTDAAKHGPALGVIPVLIPLHPYFNNLFVFSHF